MICVKIIRTYGTDFLVKSSPDSVRPSAVRLGAGNKGHLDLIFPVQGKPSVADVSAGPGGGAVPSQFNNLRLL